MARAIELRPGDGHVAGLVGSPLDLRRTSERRFQARHKVSQLGRPLATQVVGPEAELAVRGTINRRDDAVDVLQQRAEDRS
ncbi:MAG TPA: hypothetical protein PK493_09820, partial [Pseudomonadota bacterium]|nr:hypothetical protein [Pseudomonadota bacterium]